MKDLLSNKWLLAVLGIALVALITMVAVTLHWSSTRFTRISACTLCHEIFVNEHEYAAIGEMSSSVEDFKPSKASDPGLFNVTVGCAECHAYPYNEYRESPHYDNDLGVRPGCVGCHDPHSIREVFTWKFFYVNKGGVGESPFHAISQSMRDIPQWEELRIELAKKVRNSMIEDKSGKCQVCHKTESEWFNDIKRHKKSLEKGEKSCIHCHYNLVHGDVDWDKDHG